jgi:hypothetical protein
MIGATDAFATHFRYGNLTWAPAASPANTVNFTLEAAWRRDYPFVNNGGPECINTTGTTLATFFVACTGPGGLPGVGDVVWEPNAEVFPGQGANINMNAAPISGPGLLYRITSIDVANNWVFGLGLDPTSLPGPPTDTLLTKTYTSTGDFTAFFMPNVPLNQQTQRISAIDPPDEHLNNPDGGYRVETKVNVGTQGNNSSPLSGMPPIVRCPINGLCSLRIPASDPDGDALNFRLSTAPEASIITTGIPNSHGTVCPVNFCQPGAPFAPNAASISSSGLYTWNTTGAQLASNPGLNTLYSTQITVEDLTPGNVVKSKVALDFMIQLVASIGSPPVFDQPPTPTCGTTQTVAVGNTMNFSVQASDPELGPVTLNATGLPAGATMTPPLPTTSVAGMPVSSAFSWTPAGPGTSVVTFAATDASLQEALCSITVEAVNTTLTVIKHVINNNGGTATAANFTLDSGGANDTPDNFPGAESPGTVVTLDPGSYSVSETGPSGYSASFSADCAGTIALGQQKTCTVTNDDIAPTLTVIKHVINDNGGTSVAANFTMTVTNSASPPSFPGAESPGTQPTVNAGSYSVSETGPAGYSASYSAGCSGTLAPGGTATCTVTNNDIAPTLTVIKHVINDNGGTAAASAFTLDSGGVNDTPSNFPGAEAPGTNVTLDAGSYNVSETGPAGYTASYSAGCSGYIAIAQNKTCTVTNDDQPAHLTVIKHVINDNNGASSASAFTLDSGGTNDTPSNFPGAEAPGTNVTLDAGSYNVTETGPSGYTASYSADCAGTLAPGQSKTCTVTNDDVPGVPPVTTITLAPADPDACCWYTFAVKPTVAATDADGDLAETRCVLDPPTPPATFDDIPPGCPYLAPSSYVLTDGVHTLYAASKDLANNKESPPVSKTFKIDRTPPTSQFGAQPQFQPNSGAFNVSWSGTDALSGVKDYDVRYRVATAGGSFGPYTQWYSDTTQTTASYNPVAGTTICFSSRTRDNACWEDPHYSPEVCTTAPYDDPSLTRTGTWSTVTGTGYFGPGVSRSTTYNNKLTLAGLRGSVIGVLVTKQPGGGPIELRWNGSTRLSTSLSATTVQKKVLLTFNLGSVQTGTLDIVQTNYGTVDIDAAGAYKDS